jgi:hypothetical protein
MGVDALANALLSSQNTASINQQLKPTPEYLPCARRPRADFVSSQRRRWALCLPFSNTNSDTVALGWIIECADACRWHFHWLTRSVCALVVDNWVWNVFKMLSNFTLNSSNLIKAALILSPLSTNPTVDRLCICLILYFEFYVNLQS